MNDLYPGIVVSPRVPGKAAWESLEALLRMAREKGLALVAVYEGRRFVGWRPVMPRHMAVP